MSSREIADLTGKEHKHVLRDIRAMLDELQVDGPVLDHPKDAPVFGGKTESSTGGRQTKVFVLPKREMLILLPGRQQLDRSLTTP